MRKRGFTLVELLIVVAIIGMLATIVLVGLNGGRSKSRDGRRVADLKSLQAAMEAYYAQTSTYPQATGCASNTDLWSSWSCWSTLLPTSYLATMPVDPLNTDLGNCATTQNCHIYHYCVYNNGQSFAIGVNLENPPPPATGSASALAACPIGGPNTYWVSS